MGHVNTKIGNQINAVTYEHFCDSVADMEKINPKEITLGSVCIVLDGGLQVFLANSKKEWIPFSMAAKEEEEEIIIPIDEAAFEDAFTSDENEVTIKLTQALNLSAPLQVDSGKSITIDLNDNDITTSTVLFNVNGGTLTINGNGIINAQSNIANVTNGGTVIVNGGTFDSTASNYGIGAIGNGSSIVFNDGSLTTTEGGLMAFDGGSITFNGGTLNTRDNFAIGTNGSAGRGGNLIMMKGGEINAHITSNGYEAIGIYLPNDDTFIMTGGKINVTEGAGIVQRGGSCTIRGGIITCTGTPGKTGWVGDNKTKMSESAVIYHQSANYPAKDTIRLSISGGIFNGVDHSIEILSNEETPNVSITGGIFNPELEV